MPVPGLPGGASRHLCRVRIEQPLHRGEDARGHGVLGPVSLALKHRHPCHGLVLGSGGTATGDQFPRRRQYRFLAGIRCTRHVRTFAPFPSCISRRWRSRNGRNIVDAMSSSPGEGRHAADPQQGGDADGDSADDRKDYLPGRRGHQRQRDAVRGGVSGHDRRSGIGGDDQQLRPGPGHHDQQQLSDAEGRPGDRQADEDGAQATGAGVEGPDAGIDAGDSGQGEYGQGEEKPAEKTDGAENEQGSEEEHGGLHGMKVTLPTTSAWGVV